MTNAAGFTVVAWGDNSYGQISVPAGLTNVIAIAAGSRNSLALRQDGTVVAWGDNSLGQTNVPTGLSNVVAIASGTSTNVALRSDGTVVVWPGPDSSLNAPITNGVAISRGANTAILTKDAIYVGPWLSVPQYPQYWIMPGKFIAVADGDSACLGVESDGTVIGLTSGTAPSGLADVPPGVGPAVALACGASHALALLQNGTVAAWGDNSFGQTNVPAGLSGVVAVAAGGNQSLALTSDGHVIDWGTNGVGPVPFFLTNAVAISAGKQHALALIGDGSPQIAIQPFNGSFNYEQPALLTAFAVGAPALTCQWFFQGTPIPGATNFSLTISSVHLENFGQYFFGVTNRNGVALSSVLVRYSAGFSTYKNLDFESALVLAPSHPLYLRPDRALPGWTPIGGGTYLPIDDWSPTGRAPEITLFTQNPGNNAFEGNYSVLLVDDASIAQTGQISSGAKQLRFLAAGRFLDGLFDVSLGGQSLLCTAIGKSEYVADISRFAGMTAELKIASQANTSYPFGNPLLYLDSLSISGDPVSLRPTVVAGLVDNTHLRLTFPCALGASYTVQATTDLRNWRNLVTLQATNTVVEFFDSFASNAPTTLYRVISTPP